jgi:hypothetical protein
MALNWRRQQSATRTCLPSITGLPLPSFQSAIRHSSSTQTFSDRARAYFRSLGPGWVEVGIGLPLVAGVTTYVVFFSGDWLELMTKDSTFVQAAQDKAGAKKEEKNPDGSDKKEMKYRLKPIYHDGKLIAYQREPVVDEVEEKRLQEEKEKREYYG